MKFTVAQCCKFLKFVRCLSIIFILIASNQRLKQLARLTATLLIPAAKIESVLSILLQTISWLMNYNLGKQQVYTSMLIREKGPLVSWGWDDRDGQHYGPLFWKKKLWLEFRGRDVVTDGCRDTPTGPVCIVKDNDSSKCMWVADALFKLLLSPFLCCL